tara:strand:- start:397 stop:606 length:210 start_codon:yes stop_codon:yes gene_type:complete
VILVNYSLIKAIRLSFYIVINPMEFRFSKLFIIAAIGSNHDEHYFIDKYYNFQYLQEFLKQTSHPLNYL